jgi:predicted Rossmann fold nucleotide-binding protein DprA/Smf involved in DNA uptake
MMMKTKERVGFSGTRKGMSAAQKDALEELLYSMDTVTTIHHGDCVGADLEAHDLAVEYGYRTVAHPPENESLRAFVDADAKMLPLPYLERDRAIVDATDMLIATPEHAIPDNGGTWYTIRYALSQGKPVVIIPKVL